MSEHLQSAMVPANNGYPTNENPNCPEDVVFQWVLVFLEYLLTARPPPERLTLMLVIYNCLVGVVNTGIPKPKRAKVDACLPVWHMSSTNDIAKITNQCLQGQK
jgi:hypothetical protein